MTTELPQLSKTSFRALLTNSWWTFSTSWAAHRSLMLALILVTLLLSLVPAGLAIAIRGLINAISPVAKESTNDLDQVVMWLGISLVITLADVIGGFAKQYLERRLSDELNLRITTDVLNHAARLDVAHFEDPRFQDMMERIQSDISRKFSLFIKKVLTVLGNVVQLITLTIILFAIEPLVMAVLLSVALPYLLLQWQLAKSRYTEEFSRTTKMRWTRYFVTRLTSEEWVPESKLFNLAPLFVHKFRTLMEEFRDQNQHIYRRIFVGSSIFAGISSIAFFATFARVALRVISGSLTLGDAAIYGGATGRLRNSLENAIVALTQALEQTLHIDNLRQFLRTESRIQATGSIVPASICGEITVDNVTFSYPGANAPVLHNISFEIQPGEAVAIVGRNGAGKTTLAKLLARLYLPDSGVIKLDQINLHDLQLDYLHRQISFVFQKFGRYEATAADNIAYGNWEHLLDNRCEIERLASDAGLDRLIQEMPDGFDTFLGRMFGDYTLSGGQWQKIAIARAFARQPSLLILDEPTSNLDAINEYRIFSRFRELAKGRTTILISHRFSTVSLADRILVLDQGRLVEAGNHDELCAQNGLYAQMYHIQRQKLHGDKVPQI